jgi:DNA-binding CsgD family transcriptional regulator
MAHLVFGFYLLSLFSGVFLLSQLYSNKSSVNELNDKAFADYYSLIAGFVCISAACLYLHINLPSPKVFNSYTSIIFIFLGTLPYSMTKYHRVALQLVISPKFNLFLTVQITYGAALACLIWWLPAQWSPLFFSLSIGMLICSLVIIAKQAKSSKLFPNRTTFAKRLSKALVVQSFSLPLIEVLLFNSHLSNDGVTYSLPLVFLINNMMLWKFKQHLMFSPFSQPILSLALDQLSPKEQEIAAALSKGLSNKQIAFEMNISPSTVKNHLYSIFKKCHVTNRVELVTKLQKIKPVEEY